MAARLGRITAMEFEEGNLNLIKHVYGKWSSGKEGSFESFIGLLADDVQWYSLGAGNAAMAFTATCHSRDEVVNYFTGLAKEWEMQDYSPAVYVAQGDWVVMRGTCSWKHRRTNKVCNTPKADFLRLRNGKVVEFHEFFDTAAAFAATQ
jgi:ketosteroid isomerase-like protein